MFTQTLLADASAGAWTFKTQYLSWCWKCLLPNAFLVKYGLKIQKTCQCSLSLPLYFVIVNRRRAECSAMMGASSQRDELSQQPPPSLLLVPSLTPILQSHSSGWQDEYLLLPPLLQLVRIAFCEVVGSLVNWKLRMCKHFRVQCPWSSVNLCCKI